MSTTMSHSRTLLRILPRSQLVHRTFTTTRPAFVNVGDAIPNIELVEGSPGNKVNLANELKGKGVVIGVPAAFSTCPYICPSTTWQPALAPSGCILKSRPLCHLFVYCCGHTRICSSLILVNKPNVTTSIGSKYLSFTWTNGFGGNNIQILWTSLLRPYRFLEAS